MVRPAALLRIDLAAHQPVYQQIADGIRALLVEGKLRPGDPLPTVRQLATDLGVHHNTVAEAYRQLAEEGWLELKRRRGARVVERSGPRKGPEAGSDFARQLKHLVAKAIADGVPAKAVAKRLGLAARKLPEGSF